MSDHNRHGRKWTWQKGCPCQACYDIQWAYMLAVPELYFEQEFPVARIDGDLVP